MNQTDFPSSPQTKQLNSAIKVRREAKRQGAVRRPRRRRCRSGEGTLDFFARFASMRTSYEQHKRKTMEHFRLSRKLSHGPVATQLWPTLAGRRVKDLYRRVLVDLVHSFKTDEKRSLLGPPLFAHLKKVFHIETAEHTRLLAVALCAQAPSKSRVLNLEVVEAKGLMAKDPNGLSDPFATVYISPDEKHNTSVQFATLQPMWAEHFSLPIKDIQQDVLHVEVWDYDNPEDTIGEKFKKLGEAITSKGFRSFFKEIAFPPIHQQQGKDTTTHDYHGFTHVVLKNIPTNHFDAWFPLREIQNGGGSSSDFSPPILADYTGLPITGLIRLRMTIGAEKERKVAAQEYRHVLYLLVINDIDTHAHTHAHEYPPPPPPPLPFPGDELLHDNQNGWSGQFESPEPDTILSRLQRHSGLLPCDIDLARWLVFTQVQSKCYMDTRIFAPLFLSVVEHLNKDAFDVDDIQRFWSASKGLVESFGSFVQSVHDILVNAFHQVTQAHQMIQTLALLIDLLRNCAATPPAFKEEKEDGEGDADAKLTIKFIIETMTTAISTGASNFFSSVCADKNLSETRTETDDLIRIITIGQILLADLQNGRDLLQRHFQALLGIDYFDITYRVYDQKYGKIVENLVTKISANLKPLTADHGPHATSSDRSFDDDEEDNVDSGDITTKTTLFELYLALKQFADLFVSTGAMKSDKMTGLSIHDNFHLWFFASVNHWLALAWHKARGRIKAAVDLDDLCPVYENSRLSSSAVDSTLIFHQILITWNQLSWPDVDSSTALVAIIMDDLCACVIYYADVLYAKWEALESHDSQNQSRDICSELCLVINNIEHVGLEMGPITEKFCLDEMFRQLDLKNGSVCALRFRTSLDTLIENAGANVGAKMNQIIGKIWTRMKPTIDHLFEEIVENPWAVTTGDDDDDDEDKDRSIEEVMTYLQRNFLKLQDHLSDTAFDKVLAGTWLKISNFLLTTTHKCVEKKRPPDTFRRIRNLTKSLVNFFRHPTNLFETDNSFEVKEIEAVTDLHGTKTSDLILKFQIERSQGHLKSCDSGTIALRAVYRENLEVLWIEILNCTNLTPADSNGLSDPFVKIRLIPRNLYADVPQVRTKVQKYTLFPMFEDEKFSIPLSSNSLCLGGLLHVIVKDYDMIGRNDFIGETFIPLNSILVINTDEQFNNEIPQTHLNLSVPGDSKILHTLENRPSDREAVHFAKKQGRRRVFHEKLKQNNNS